MPDFALDTPEAQAQRFDAECTRELSVPLATLKKRRPGSTGHRALDRWLRKHFSDIAGKHVLEIGGGNSRIADYLALQGAQVLCTDVSIRGVELTRRRCQAHGVTGKLDIAVMDAARIALPDERVDAIFGLALLHHLPEAAIHRVMQETYRVLRPGGKAVFWECIEDCRAFKAIQNLFPTAHRPSVLQRRAWTRHLSMADDRELNSALLKEPGVPLEIRTWRPFGLLTRMRALAPHKWHTVLSKTLFPVTDIFDDCIMTMFPPLRKLAAFIIVEYVKPSTAEIRK